MAEFTPIPTDPRFQDLSGQQFGKLKVLGYAGKRATSLFWHVCCACGNEKVVSGPSLKAGSTKSCGCLHKSIAAKLLTKHGHYKTSEHKIWLSMRNRCRNPRAQKFELYGGKGVTVCDRWNNFEHFLQDMGPRPSLTHSIDRIDGNGNYEPSNCRWATPKEQAHNMRTNRWVTIDGNTLILKEACQKYGISTGSFYKRLKKGWSVEKIFKTPTKKQEIVS